MPRSGPRREASMHCQTSPVECLRRDRSGENAAEPAPTIQEVCPLEDGVETFLDLETGWQIVTPGDNAAKVSAEQLKQDPIHGQLLRAIAEAGWNPYFTDAPSAMVDLRGDAALYTSRYYVAEELRTLVCNTRSPIIVPKRARRKVMAFITRANFGMMHGGFEMSLEYGTLFFRVSCGLQDGTLTSAMVTQMANAGVWSFDRYLPRMLEVV